MFDHPARWLAGTVALGIAGGLAFVILPTSSHPSRFPAANQSQVVTSGPGQTSIVEATFTKAIQTDREIQAPSSPPPATTAVRKAQLQNGEAALARYFVPAVASREEQGLINAVNAEANPNFRNIGSGVKNVKFDSVAVSGSTATLTADVTTWAKFQQQDNGSWVTSDPVNVMIYNMTMTRNSSGQWIVSSMVGDFAPGQGP